MATRGSLLLLPLLLSAPLPAQRIDAAATMQSLQRIDGIAAIVNGEVITIGELDRALRIARPDSPADIEWGCTIPAGAAAVGVDASGSRDTRSTMLECLIDELLVHREVRRFPQLDVPPSRVAEVMGQIRADFVDDAALAADLARDGQSLEALRAEIGRQLLVEAYVETRFRATIAISEDDARQAYAAELIPDMTRRGIEPPPFEQVRDDFVIPILREREVNRRVQSWIADLRRRAVITRRLR